MYVGIAVIWLTVPALAVSIATFSNLGSNVGTVIQTTAIFIWDK